jgi:hypothetical protein
VFAVGACFSNHRHGVSIVRHRFPGILKAVHQKGHVGPASGRCWTSQRQRTSL